ncbi:MAG: TolC family protein [Myxococcaceae bacterium]|nr:TolC family protein [Myxococcaceae bacterium]
MKNRLGAAAFGLAVLLWSRLGVAEEAVSLEKCLGLINRNNLMACALGASPQLLEALAEQRAAQGRRDAARPFLPSNPTVGASVSSRATTDNRTTNWSISLGQELEVAGQSGVRADVADGELRAQGHRVIAARQDIVAQAWSAYFAVLALQERLQLAAKLEQATTSVAITVRAMAANGVSAEVDADIADTAALKSTADRLALESALAASKAQLGRMTGCGVDAPVEGALEPLHVSVEQLSVARQPALLALDAQRQAAWRRVDLLRRERFPNLTVSFFAQNDGFDERVLGLGLGIPIPLPQPVGRTGAGQLAEAEALAERTEAECERVRRELQAELATAKAEFEAATRTRQLYTLERVQRATTRLDAIAVQVKAGRLPVRDALLAQQALVEQLKAGIEAREVLCLASARIARAAGSAIEGNAR